MFHIYNKKACYCFFSIINLVVIIIFLCYTLYGDDMSKNIDNNEISEDFRDVIEDDKSKNYIIIVILYLLVIALTVLLIFGLINKDKETNLNSHENVLPETVEEIR